MVIYHTTSGTVIVVEFAQIIILTAATLTAAGWIARGVYRVGRIWVIVEKELTANGSESLVDRVARIDSTVADHSEQLRLGGKRFDRIDALLKRREV